MDKKEDIKFEIDQLRKDKIIYAVEACATILVCYSAPSILWQFGVDDTYTKQSSLLLNVLGVGYFLYMAIGNFYRLVRVKKLEKQLKEINN